MSEDAHGLRQELEEIDEAILHMERFGAGSSKRLGPAELYGSDETARRPRGRKNNRARSCLVRLLRTDNREQWHRRSS